MDQPMTIAERREYQREARDFLAEERVHLDEPTCRECGCSDSLACPDGCWWVAADLCSQCAVELGLPGLPPLSPQAQAFLSPGGLP